MKVFFTSIIICLIFSPTVYAQWEHLTGPYGGDISCFTKSGNRIFAGTEGGVYYSDDNCRSWTALYTGLKKFYVLAITSNSKEVYIIARNGYTSHCEIYKTSVQGDQPWQSIFSSWYTLLDISADDKNLYVSAYASNTDVLYSADDGVSWFDESGILSNPNDIGVGSIQILGNKVFACKYSQIYLATVGTGNWAVTASRGIIDHVLKLVVIGKNIYACAENHVYKSSDYGTSWQTLFTSSGGYFSSVAFDGKNIFLGKDYFGVVRSSDSGITWEDVSHGLKAKSVHALLYTDSIVIAGTDGGVDRAVSNGTLWIPSDTDLAATGISSMVTNDTLIMANDYYFLSNHFFRYFVNSTGWTSIDSGLARGIEPAEIFASGSTYFALDSSKLFRSDDLGNIWQNAGLNHPVSSFAAHNKLLAAASYDGLNWSIDNGSTWNYFHSKLMDFGQCGFMNSNLITVELSKGIYISSPSKLVLQKTDFMINQRIQSIKSLDSTIFIAYENGIYRSDDYGKTVYETDQGIDSGFITSFEPTPHELFAGTNIGLYESQDNGGTWYLENEDLPRQEVTTLSSDDKYIYVALNGFGIWRKLLNPQVVTSDSVKTFNGINHGNDFNIILHQEELMVQFKQPSERWITIENLFGQAIYEMKCYQNPVINISLLPDGIYLLSVMDRKDNYTSTKKFVKAN